jgi:hypothetical protein
MKRETEKNRRGGNKRQAGTKWDCADTTTAYCYSISSIPKKPAAAWSAPTVPKYKTEIDVDRMTRKLMVSHCLGLYRSPRRNQWSPRARHIQRTWFTVMCTYKTLLTLETSLVLIRKGAAYEQIKLLYTQIGLPEYRTQLQCNAENLQHLVTKSVKFHTRLQRNWELLSIVFISFYQWKNIYIYIDTYIYRVSHLLPKPAFL